MLVDKQSKTYACELHKACGGKQDTVRRITLLCSIPLFAKSCLLSWEDSVQTLVGPLLKIELKRKGCVYIGIGKWQDLRHSSRKGCYVKIVRTSDSQQLGNNMLEKSANPKNKEGNKLH